jgi:MATE family multidrug resistance protein
MNDLSPLDLGDAGPRIAGNQRGAWWLETKALALLAAPLAITQLAQMVILATDTFLLGHLSKEALAAAALASNVFFMVWLVGMGPATALTAIVAHIRGANDNDLAGVRNAVRMGCWAMLLMTPVLMSVLLYTEDLLLMIGQEPALAAQASIFMSALMWSLPPSLGFQVLRNFSTAVDKPMVPLIVSGLVVLCNAALGYALIFGHFGLPRLELFGSGLGSAIAQLIGFLAMLAFCLWHPALKRYRMLLRFTRPHWAHLREVFTLGLPIGLTMMFEVALFVAAALTMGLFGADMLAAHQIAITVPSLTFMVPMGIGMAATVRVGLAMGAGDMVAARRAGWLAMGMSGIFMLISSVALLLFPVQIAGLWLPATAENQPVLTLAISFLMVAALFQLADGLQVTAAMSLRGLKDARMPMWIAGTSYWLIGFPICLWLGFAQDMKGLGVWYGLAAGLMVATVALVWRFHALSKPSKQAAPQIQQQEE